MASPLLGRLARTFGCGLVFALGLALLGACANHRRVVSIDLPPAPKPLETDRVSLEAGRLLGADPVASTRAHRHLTSLDEAGRKALLEFAASIPQERDPRWLDVLDENHALPDLTFDERVHYLIWKVKHGDTVGVMKAQSELLDLARSEPEAMVRRLEEGGEGTDALALALALAGERRAVPALLTLYRQARTPAQREAAAGALGTLVGKELAPRVRGAPADLEADAAAIQRWYEQGTKGGGDAKDA